MDTLASIARDEPLRRALAQLSFVTFGAYAVFAILPSYAYDELGLTPDTYGLVMCVGAAGWVIGAIMTPRLSTRLGVPASLTLSSGVVGVGLLTLGLPLLGLHAAMSLLVGRLVMSMGWPAYVVNERTLRQTRLPERMQGRGTAVATLITGSTSVVASLVAGGLAISLGIGSAIVLAGLVALVGALWTFRMRLTSGEIAPLPQTSPSPAAGENSM